MFSKRAIPLARERYGKDVLAPALRWILDQGPTVALWGARRRPMPSADAKR